MPWATQSPMARNRGLAVIFGSTFLELVGVFMLTPWLLLQLKTNHGSTAVAGLFAATAWLGVFLMTPFASAVTQTLGRRPTLWLSALIPVLATTGFGLSDHLGLWFACQLVAGMASGLRWVLAEAVVAELAPARQRGRWVGLFETMVGATFVIGPVLLAWMGTDSDRGLWAAWAFMIAGLAWSLRLPPLPQQASEGPTQVGLAGVWQALGQHPQIMAVGFIGGFFESGLTGILPLYGLALGLTAAAATLLVAASGLGSALMMLPAGMLADRMAHHPQGRWGSEAEVRLRLMRACATITLLATALLPWVAGLPWLAGPVAFVWGGAGGCLYTLAMIDIGSREQGLTLVNSTAVLVLSYTLGGVLAPALGGIALQASPAFGFPTLLLATAALGVWLLRRRPH